MTTTAASQLRAVLPPDLAGRLDLSRLTSVPASFVDEALKWRYSDLLFTVHGASSNQVQAWTARAVTAETLDQVFD